MTVGTFYRESHILSVETIDSHFCAVESQIVDFFDMLADIGEEKNIFSLRWIRTKSGEFFNVGTDIGEKESSCRIRHRRKKFYPYLSSVRSQRILPQL